MESDFKTPSFPFPSFFVTFMPIMCKSYHFRLNKLWFFHIIFRVLYCLYA